jgi:hypothetical protein
MPIISYFLVIGSVLLGLLFLAEAQLGPGTPPRAEVNPLHEQMAQRAERAKARLAAQTRAPAIANASARPVNEAAMAQASAPEMSAKARSAATTKVEEATQAAAPKPAKVAERSATKKKTKVARVRDGRDRQERHARYQMPEPPRQYFIGYQ